MRSYVYNAGYEGHDTLYVYASVWAFNAIRFRCFLVPSGQSECAQVCSSKHPALHSLWVSMVVSSLLLSGYHDFKLREILNLKFRAYWMTTGMGQQVVLIDVRNTRVRGSIHSKEFTHRSKHNITLAADS